ncbi:MAG: M1 family aminopeptidase [Bacteroidales bacterium]
MNLRYITYILIFILFSSHNIFSQEYFQQDVNYIIKVELDDERHMLKGVETIEYTNNSPNKLDSLYFHLWPNAYKNNKTALAKQLMESEGKESMFNNPRQRGYIDSLDFRVNDNRIEWEFHSEHQDICKLILNKPLESGKTIKITTPFRVKLPLGIYSKMGYVGQAYKITQWYPKPAVYDRKGWHPMPNLQTGEFYSEFGSFDVSITLPKNYVVAASGNLETKKEIEWLNEKARETTRLFDYDNYAKEFPESNHNRKTIRYKLKNAHDFAWFTDKRYQVIKDSIKLASSEKKITTWVYYVNDETKLWQHNVTDYIHESLQFFSEKYGDYPYQNCSVVLGERGSAGNDMEYPGITVIEHHINKYQLEQIIAHEIAHNWFSGMLGFNERDYPFLDKGLATLSETRYMHEKHSEDFAMYKLFGLSENFSGILGIDALEYRDLNDIPYLLKARQNTDQPTNTVSEKFNFANYVAIAYGKSGRAFEYLMHVLGEKKFDAIIQELFTEWSLKHPYPADIRKTFENRTEKNLDWFFDGLMKSNKKIDYTFKKIQKDKLLIKNKGDIAAPLMITGLQKNKKSHSRWIDGFTGKKWIEFPTEDSDVIKIDHDKQMLELYRHNNRIETRGLFKKIAPLKLEFGGLMNDPDYTQIHYFPVLGWNYYDKAMPGLVIYDSPFPLEKFNCSLIPMFSTGKTDLTGQGNIRFSMFPDKIFNRISLGISGKQYSISDVYKGQFEQIKTEVVFRFDNKSPNSRAKNKFQLTAIYATDIKDISDRILEGATKPLSKQQFFKSSLIHDNSEKTINPYQISANIEASKNFTKTWLEGKFKYSYYLDQGISLRMFGGMFINKTIDLPWTYGFQLSGDDGLHDYTYENTYLGRFEPPHYENAIRIFSQQFYPSEGGFALRTPLGITKDWLASANLKTSIPLIAEIPLHAYANIGFFGNTKTTPIEVKNKDWAYELGVKLSLLNFVDVYFPVTASQNLEKSSEYYSSQYGEKIRFHIHFDLFDPSEIYDNIIQ